MRASQKSTARSLIVLIAVALAICAVGVPLTAEAAEPTDCVSTGHLKAELKRIPNAGYACTYYGSEGEVFGEVLYDNDGKQVSGKKPTGANAPEEVAECSWSKPSGWWQQCIWLPMMSTFGTAFIAFGIFIVDIASLLFDLLVRYVVIGFAQSLTDLGMTEGIQRGWTAVRDVINIGIIGMFVFIAINIILGIKEFGQKKLIANVLIVALLLNFSLLFTRIVIDVSNFAAHAIYSEVTAIGPTGNNTVSQKFLLAMKMTSVTNSYYTVKEMATKSDSGWTALLFGLTAMVMLLGLALVLLYGCFLMAARGLILIFLMIASPLAFATYLIPALAKSEYGLLNWWRTLLNTAIFAPLLMLSLAISLYIVQSASGTVEKMAGSSTAAGAGSTIGAIVGNPRSLETGSAWAVIWVYVLGIGLLFLSIKLSSKFAGKISGFNPTMGALAAPFSLAAGVIAPALLTRSLGAGALARAGSLQSDARKATLDAGIQRDLASRLTHRASLTNDPGMKAQHLREAAAARSQALAHEDRVADLLKKAAKAKADADKKYNLMDTAVGKGFNALMGNKGMGESTKDDKGEATRVAQKARQAAEMAEAAKPSNEQLEEARREAEKEANMRHAAEFEDRRVRREAANQERLAAEAREKTAKEEADAAKAKVAQDKTSAEYIRNATEVVNAQARKAERERTHKDETSQLADQIRNATTEAQKRELQAILDSKERLHRTDIRNHDSEISAATRTRDKIEEPLNRATQKLSEAASNLKEAGEKFKAADRSFADIQTTINREVDTRMKGISAGATEAGQEVAGNLGYAEGGQKIMEAARETYAKRRGSAFRAAQFFKEVNEESGNNSPPPTT